MNDLVRQFTHPYLLLGDFNAHSPHWWTSQLLDGLGRQVEDFLSAHNLVTLNNNQPTHFSLAHNTESAIDLSLCSPELGTWFDWSVDSDVHCSDHYPISITTTFNHQGTTSFVPHWNLKKAEWEKFSELCNNIQLEHEDNSDQYISGITQAISTAATQTIPKTKPPRNKPSVPWWSPEIRRAIAKRKRPFKAYFRNRTEENLIIRNRERAKTQRIIRTAKRTSWQLYISKLTSSTPLSQIWQMVRRLSGKRTQATIPILRIPGNNNRISDPLAVTNTIAERFAKHSSNNNYMPGFIEHASANYNTRPIHFHSNNEEDYNGLFSLSELQLAIASSGNTSIGPDDLHYSFFRHLPVSTLGLVLRYLNRLWQEHAFPDVWRDATVVAVPKPGKPRHNPDNYRPIALTSCFGKIFERMVAKRLAFILEKTYSPNTNVASAQITVLSII